MSIIFVKHAERDGVHVEMEKDESDFNRNGGAGQTLERKCRPIGSNTTTPTWWMATWKHLTGSRLTRWLSQVSDSGAVRGDREVYDRRDWNVRTAMADMGLEFIPDPPPELL